jgi:hypothetical protein
MDLTAARRYLDERLEGVGVATAAYADRFRRCRCPSSGNAGGIGASIDSRT